MITKEVLQKFIDSHIDEIGEILPGGLKNKVGKWLLVCPIMDRFELDFSKVQKSVPVEEVHVSDVEEVVEEVETGKKKAKENKKKSKKK